MSSIDDLLVRLDEVGPNGWEDEYVRHRVELSRDQAGEVVASTRACAKWFAFRFEAGPPGVPLPTFEHAVKMVMGGKNGTPPDAYRLVFTPRALPDDASADLILALLCNSAACALKGGTTWLATWLAAHAGIAAIALGAPNRAWRFLDGLTFDGRRHKQLDRLAIFEPIRGNRVLERNSWIRAAICQLWPALNVPAVPRLPPPTAASNDVLSLESTLSELARIGAEPVRVLVKCSVNAANRMALDEHTDDALVRDLRARAMVPGSATPDNVKVPSWFENWARAVARSGEPHLARLAGLMLHRSGIRDSALIAALVLPASRAVDLGVISAEFAPEVRPLLEELIDAREVLPAQIADALVAMAIPGHVARKTALIVLAHNISVLESLEKRTGGAVEGIIDTIRAMIRDRAQDLDAARPCFERLLVKVRQAAARVADGRHLTADVVERVAGTIEVTELTIGLLELAVEAKECTSLEKLLMALAFHRRVEGTEYEDYWRAPLSQTASEAIYSLREIGLFGLRLKLLDELIAIAHPLISRADLHFQRANTRRALSPNDPRETNLVLDDLHEAMRLHRAVGDAGGCAAATAAWVNTLAWVDAGGDRRYATFHQEAGAAIEQALQLPLDPFDQALLHQAHAHLIRSKSPRDAAKMLDTALSLVSAGNPFRAELAAELVATLDLAGNADEAVHRGYAYMDEVSSGTQPIELGMLHLSAGSVLAVSGEYIEARRQLEAGLALVRGRSAHNEEIARLHLARLGLAMGDRALTEEHVRFLRDHQDDLDPLTLRDLHGLEMAMADLYASTSAHWKTLSDDAECDKKSVNTVPDTEQHAGTKLEIDRDAKIAQLREQLTKLDPVTMKYDIATAKHNLAGILMFGENMTCEQFTEGLLLAREAAEVRVAEVNARHHWETAYSAGSALVMALKEERFNLLPLPKDKAVTEARSLLLSAIDAARLLGPGEEMAEAAFALCELALEASSTIEMIAQADVAWDVVRTTAPYLVLYAKSREREAETALRVASSLANRLAAQALVVPTPGIIFVLQGENAELVRRWLVRSQEPTRRPLRARLSRPLSLSAGLRETWLSALEARDPSRMADALDRIRTIVPDFPDKDLGGEQTWRWLQARPGSVAVAIFYAESATLSLIMQVDNDGRRRSWVLGLDVPPPPLPLRTFAGLIHDATPDAGADAALEALAAWLREHAVVPIERFLGARPTAVLWSPGPGIRLVAPGAIWERVPVATTASLLLPDLSTSPGRRRSSLVVLADPGPAKPRFDLRGHGMKALEDLERAAAVLGPVRLLGSVAGRFGRELLGKRSCVRDTPASAYDVLTEAGEHEVIVMIVHGEVATLENAAILCIDGAGEIDRLDVSRLNREPDRFAGATVLLLSCEGGRIGDSLAEPGGLAGTLVSAGARCVVAPLWPVHLDVAVQVGRAVLCGFDRDVEPWDVLAEMEITGIGDSPVLGGPPPSMSDRQSARKFQRLAFVTWVG